MALSSEAQQLPSRGREKSCVAFCSVSFLSHRAALRNSSVQLKSVNAVLTAFLFFLKGVRLSTFCNFFHSAFPLFSFFLLLFFKLKGQSRAFQRGFFCLCVNKYFWGKGVKEGGFIHGYLRKTYKQRWSFNLKICLTVQLPLFQGK